MGPAADPRAYLLACYSGAEIAPLDLVAPTAAPLFARVNHGLWIASCSCGARKAPTPGCVVFLDTPLGWCVRCGNRAWGGGWRRVIVPEPAERRLIEAVLLCRPNVGDRNWEPHETLAQLVAQNREHGDPVPDFGDGPPDAAVPAGPSPSRFPPASTMAAVLARANPRGLLKRLRGR